VQPTLDPDVFDAAETNKPHLKSHIAEWLQQHIYTLMNEHGYPDPEKKVKLYLSGSLTTYQWSAQAATSTSTCS
jgi:hypothetical protein